MIFKSRTLTATAAIALLCASALTSMSWAQSTAPAAAGAAPSMDKPAAAAAQDKPMTSKEVAAAFTKSDVNKDGKLDKTEAEGIPGLVARFDQIDTDGDKLISKAELDKAMKQ